MSETRAKTHTSFSLFSLPVAKAISEVAMLASGTSGAYITADK